MTTWIEWQRQTAYLAGQAYAAGTSADRDDASEAAKIFVQPYRDISIHGELRGIFMASFSAERTRRLVCRRGTP